MSKINKAINGAKTKINGAATHAADATASLQAKLKAARAEARAAKAERDAFAARAEEAEARAAEREHADHHYQTEAQRRMASAFSDVLIELGAPSWSRAIAGFVVSVAVALGIGWLIGYVVGYAMVGAVVLTGSVMLAGMIYIIGLVISMLLSAIAAGRAYKFVVSGDIDRAYEAAKDKVKAAVTPKKSFSGLFTRSAA